MNPKELLNYIANNLDNFENLLKPYKALNELKLLVENLNEVLNKLEISLINLREFLENNDFKNLLDFENSKLLKQCREEYSGLLMKIKQCSEEFKKNYDNIINLNVITYQDTKKIYFLINEIEKGIYSFLGTFRELSDEIEEYINSYSIDKKYRDKIAILKTLINKLNEYYNELTKHYDNIKEIRDKYREINLQLAYFRITQQDFESEYFIPIITNLKAGLYTSTGLYCIHILNYITGLHSISANPISEIISMRIEDEEKSHSLEELLYRYPPFEPIAIKNTKGIVGSKIWFIKSKNIKFGSHSFKNKGLLYSYVIKGDIEKEYTTNKLKSVEPIELLENNDVNYYILIKLKNNIFLKYGSKELKELISQRKSILEIEKIYKEHASKRGRKVSYSPTNLSYVWFCMWGRGLSTDPWDFECPFQRYCIYGKNIISNNNKRKCPLWSWSRRIHPKVYPVSKRKTPNKKLDVSESFNGIIPIYGRNVLIKDEYCGVQFNIPGGIYPVNIEFETPIGKELAKTNVIGLAIDKNFIKTMISLLLNNKIDNYNINLFDIKVSISDIILSKCFLIASTNKGLNTYQLLEKDFKYIVNEYEQFKNNFKKENKVNKIFVKEVIEYAIYILLHTLAHLLVGFLSKELEIKPEDLLYLVDNTDEYYRILIAENSPIGALDIIGATKNKFGSFTDMIIKFLESAHDLLKEHEKQLELYKNLISQRIDMFKNKDPKYIYNIKIIKELRKHYSEFLKKGIVLDLHYFNTYMQLKKGDRTGYGKYGDIIDLIVKDKTINEKLKKEINNIFTLAFPTYCIDGCTSCIMFDKGCFDGLGQSITTSKELTKLFIEIISKGREFKGQGNVVLKNIIESLCKKELVALSPYIDEEGIKFLNELSKKGISVKLITNKKMVEDFNELFKKSEFEVYIMRSNHDKAYYMDNKILLTSTANLTLKSDSTNRFRISSINDNNSYKTILEQAEKWKK
ncbi:phospholipase D-like domain-containing protein [Methanocaldococcus sp.]